MPLFLWSHSSSRSLTIYSPGGNVGLLCLRSSAWHARFKHSSTSRQLQPNDGAPFGCVEMFFRSYVTRGITIGPWSGWRSNAGSFVVGYSLITQICCEYFACPQSIIYSSKRCVCRRYVTYAASALQQRVVVRCPHTQRAPYFVTVLLCSYILLLKITSSTFGSCERRRTLFGAISDSVHEYTQLPRNL